MRTDRSLHVALVGPSSLPGLTDLVEPAYRSALNAEPQSNGTAPGRIARALVRSGHRVSLVTHQRGRGGLVADGERFRIIQVPSRSNRLLQVGGRWHREMSAMGSVLEELEPDVVHSNWTYEAALAAVGSGLPHVATIRDAPLTVVRFDPRPTRLMRLTMAMEFRARSKRAVLTAVSPYMADAWRREMRDRRAVHLVPNPIDLPDDSVLQPKSGEPLLVEVANADATKNVRGLLAAFALVRRSVPNAKLMMVGHGLEQEGSVAQWARGNALAEGVEFRGSLSSEATRSLLRHAWVHPHASFSESFGNTLIEAMSSGTVVVGGHRSGAVPWVLDGGRAGVLTDVAEPAVFSRTLIDLLKDEPRRRRMEQAAREHVAREFAPAVIADKYAALYEQAIVRR